MQRAAITASVSWATNSRSARSAVTGFRRCASTVTARLQAYSERTVSSNVLAEGTSPALSIFTMYCSITSQIIMGLSFLSQRAPHRPPHRPPHGSPHRPPHRPPQRAPHRPPHYAPHRPPHGSPQPSPHTPPHPPPHPPPQRAP